MLALVQARMDSARLPGKSLLPLRGEPVLAHVVKRVSLARGVTEVVVATSVERSDDPIVSWCEAVGIACARGPLNDVLARLVTIAEGIKAPAFARVSGDSPLIDPEIVDRAVRLFNAADDPDLATNVWPRTFPAGQSVEIVRVDTARSLLESASPEDREHVTTGLYRMSERLRMVSFTSGWPASSLSMTVDTPEDYERLVRKLDTLAEIPRGWRAIVELGVCGDD